MSSTASYKVHATDYKYDDSEMENGKVQQGEAKANHKIISFEDLPPVLKFAINISWNTSKSNRIIAKFLWFQCVFFAIWVILGGMQLNFYLGIPYLFANMYGYNWAFSCTDEVFNYRNEEKSILYEIIGNDIKVAKQLGFRYKYLCLAWIFGLIIPMLIFACYLFLPRMAILQGFSPTILVVLQILSIYGLASNGISVMMSMALDVFVMVAYNTYRIKNIKLYLKSVQSILLQLNKGDVDEIEIMERLTKKQIEVENRARKYNKAYSYYAGQFLVCNAIWTVLPLTSIMNVQAAINAYGSSFLFWVAITLFLLTSLMFIFLFVLMFRNIALINMVWNSEIKKSLKQFRLAPIIRKIFGNVSELDSYLKEHEIGVARAFGYRITTEMLSGSVGILGSISGLMLYLILRSDMQQLAQ